MKTKLGQMDPVAFTELGEELITYPSMLDRLAGLDDPDHRARRRERPRPPWPRRRSRRRRIPGAELVVIPDAADSPQEENRDAWLAAVSRAPRRGSTDRTRQRDVGGLRWPRSDRAGSTSPWLTGEPPRVGPRRGSRTCGSGSRRTSPTGSRSAPRSRRTTGASWSSTSGAASPTRRRTSVDADTIIVVFSTTKGATAICANKLAQEGRLDVDAPVVEYWPEFGQAGKENVPGELPALAPGRAGVGRRPMTLERGARVGPGDRRARRRRRAGSPGTQHGYHATHLRLARRRGGPARDRQERRHVLPRRDRRSRSTSTSGSACPEEHEPRVARSSAASAGHRRRRGSERSDPRRADRPVRRPRHHARQGALAPGGAFTDSDTFNSPRRARGRDPGRRRHQRRPVDRPHVRGVRRRGRRHPHPHPGAADATPPPSARRARTPSSWTSTSSSVSASSCRRPSSQLGGTALVRALRDGRLGRLGRSRRRARRSAT